MLDGGLHVEGKAVPGAVVKATPEMMEQWRATSAKGSGLPDEAGARKLVPAWSGFICYFPRAIAAVAKLSYIANEQHNPGTPVHWDRSKSTDERDALMRHLLDEAISGEFSVDSDDVLHATKVAWRAMAHLEKLLERLASANISTI